jgi:hypothetical protein
MGKHGPAPHIEETLESVPKIINLLHLLILLVVVPPSTKSFNLESAPKTLAPASNAAFRNLCHGLLLLPPPLKDSESNTPKMWEHEHREVS